MHKVFVSYYHYNDQSYKEALLQLNEIHEIFIDASVDTGDIGEDLTDQQIRQIIRDEYLRDSTVTILLAGTETKFRKHVDWELYSSMYDGKVNKKSGFWLLIFQLLTVLKLRRLMERKKKELFILNTTPGQIIQGKTMKMITDICRIELLIIWLIPMQIFLLLAGIKLLPIPKI